MAIMDDKEDWCEPLRARRIRDRKRMQARGYHIAKFMRDLSHPRDHIGGSSMLWRDRRGHERTGLRDWADVLEFRRSVGVLTGDTLKSCSCPGCGNPRRWFLTLTMQEQRAADQAAEQLDDFLLVDPGSDECSQEGD